MMPTVCAQRTVNSSSIGRPIVQHTILLCWNGFPIGPMAPSAPSFERNTPMNKPRPNALLFVSLLCCIVFSCKETQKNEAQIEGSVLPRPTPEQDGQSN